MTQSSFAPAEEWFAGALEEHRALMLKRAASIVKNKADAEDVVQEALERAWRSRKRFVAGAKPAPWLLKITQNVALNYLRRHSGLNRGSLDEIASFNVAADVDVVKREDSRSIASAIRSLAPPQREAFVLHDLHGYSSREISLQVHRPHATVRTQIARARRHLRSALTGVHL
jgi:RNA polymerase sigma-70 factor (ECF subfamily)